MKEQKKDINLFMFQPETGENFGEFLCKRVINEMGFELNNYSNRKPIIGELDYVLTAIGGYFNMRIYRRELKDRFKKWYVWGNGVDCNPKPNGKSRVPARVVRDECVITLLRGPLTKEYYDITDDILLGDAGYLASHYFRIPEEPKKNVLITHHYDIEKKNMNGVDVELSCQMEDDENGSVNDKFNTILKSIANANIVMTSSMHVAVVAYSYGVPFAMISKRETDLSQEWKWRDMLLNIGVTKDIKLCESIEEGYSWWNEARKQIKPITTEYQQQIINSFPFDSK